MFAHRAARTAGAIALTAGALLLLDAGLTLTVGEPVTNVIARIEQSTVNKRLERYTKPPLTAQQARSLTPTQRIRLLAGRERLAARHNDAIGQIVIPKIGLKMDIIQGTDESALARGAGHYPSTALPGEGRTVAIAGHRTTFLHPFMHIDELKPGDRIILVMPYGRFNYSVQRQQVVLPTAWWVTRDHGYDRLVLSACTPMFSASHRLIVFARLASVS
jgi:sortase A